MGNYSMTDDVDSSGNHLEREMTSEEIEFENHKANEKFNFKNNL